MEFEKANGVSGRVPSTIWQNKMNNKAKIVVIL